MARVRLSKTRDWDLINSDQDLRNKDLWDAHGHRLGTIDDMIVDTDAERVVAVVLNNGDEYHARDLSIGDDAVYVLNYDATAGEPAGPVRRQYEEQPLRRRGADAEDAPREETVRDDTPAPFAATRDDASAQASAARADADRRESERRDRDEPARRSARRTYPDFADGFRQHYDREYGNLDRDYSDWEPAYRFGYDMAFETEYVGREFDAAEEDLRREYYRRMGYPMSDRHVWDDVRNAVQHAFERSRQYERQT
jgi:sporulation protein YlmC with PRC-barrel domain